MKGRTRASTELSGEARAKSRVTLREYANWDAIALAQQVASGDLSVSEVLATAYRIIERLEPAINAFVSLEDELARKLAALAPEGPLRGVPIAMKDCLGFVCGASLSFGSALATGTMLDQDD